MVPPSPLPLESRPQVAAVYRRLGLTPRPKVVFYLSEVKQVLPVLTELLRDDDARVAANAARILGQMGSRARPAVPALLAAVHHHKDVRVRRAAAYALDSDRIGWWDLRAEVANGLDLQAAAAAGRR